jgi:hypothetical protein
VHDDKLVSTSPLTDSRYRLLNKVLDAAEESRTTFRPYFDDRESAWPRLPWTEPRRSDYREGGKQGKCICACPLGQVGGYL